MAAKKKKRQGRAAKSTAAKKKVKRAPPAKKKAKRKAVKKKTPAQVAMERMGEACLEDRRYACLFYVTNPRGVSVVEMSKLEKFQHIPFTTMSGWAERDDWGKQRSEFQAKVQANLTNAMLDQVIQNRSKLLENMQRLFDDSFGRLDRQEIPEPKSLEGFISAMTRLAKLLDDMRGSMADALVPHLYHVDGDEASASDSPMAPKLSTEEAATAARTILRSRMLAQPGYQPRPEEGPTDEED